MTWNGKQEIRDQCDAQLRDFARLDLWEYTGHEDQEEELLDWLDGYKSFPGAIETAEGLMIPKEDEEETAESLREELFESAISVEIDRTVRVVLCTGGPHVEVSSTEGRPWRVYGWWGADSWERNLNASESDGFESVFGTFEDIMEMMGEKVER